MVPKPIKYSDMPPLFVMEGSDGLTYRINRADAHNLKVILEKPREDSTGFTEVHMGYASTLHGALTLLAKNYPSVMPNKTYESVMDLRDELKEWYDNLDKTIKSMPNVTNITEE